MKHENVSGNLESEQAPRLVEIIDEVLAEAVGKKELRPTIEQDVMKWRWLEA
jgi:hypothetical protein